MNKLLKSILVMMALAVVTPASAQFGNLMNAAKRKAKEAVNKKLNEAVSQPAKQVNSGASDSPNGQPPVAPAAGDVRFSYSTGSPAGIWHPATNTFEKYGRTSSNQQVSEYYVFQEDGAVLYGGEHQVGKINPDGTMSSNKTADIAFDKSSGEVKWKGRWMGKIDNHGGMFVCNERMVSADSPIAPEKEAYILFCLIANNDFLAEYRQKFDAANAQIAEHRKAQLASAKANQEMEARSGAKMILWKGGSTFGEIRGDGTVMINGSSQGRIESNGDIRVGGSVAGQLLSDGQVRKGGSIVGRIDQNGKVWLGGSVAGEIKANGEVWKGGSNVARVQNMTDRRKAAIIYFFGFYRY